jgi:multidrug efflux system membrane fusion protein
MPKAMMWTKPAMCVVLALAASGCGKGPSAAASAGLPAAPVRVAAATRRTLPVELRTIGNVEAYRTISVKSQATGVLMKVHFKEGDPVHKGQLLFEIDPRPFQQAIKQIEANLARDKALMAQSEANLAHDTAQEKFARDQSRRYLELVKQGVFSKEQGDQATSSAQALTEQLRADRAAIDSAKSAIVADQAAIDNAKLQLEYCYIYSPTEGRSGNMSVKEGNLVKLNDIELVTITQIQPVYVTFTLPERQLASVRERMKSGKLLVSATPQGQNAADSGALTFVDNSVDTNTGTIKLKATFPNTASRLWPGQFCSVALRLSEKPNVIAVPSRAVQVGQQGNYVFVVKSDSTVEMRTVTTGESVNDLVEVQGVQPGETVVTEGHVRLAPGSRVKVLS